MATTDQTVFQKFFFKKKISGDAIFWSMIGCSFGGAMAGPPGALIGLLFGSAIGSTARNKKFEKKKNKKKNGP